MNIRNLESSLPDEVQSTEQADLTGDTSQPTSDPASPVNKVSNPPSISTIENLQGDKSSRVSTKTEEDTEADSSIKQSWQELLRPSIYPIIAGGVLGALMAVVTVLGILEFLPPLDPRVETLDRQVAGLFQRVESQESTARSIEVDIARAIKAATNNSLHLGEQDKRLEQTLTRLDITEQNLRTDRSLGSPLFGVAVAQLAKVIHEGRPFEPEWVNLYALAKDSPSLKADLQRLMPIAHVGIETTYELRASLQAYRNHLFYSDTFLSKALLDGLSVFQYKFGFPVVRSPTEESALQHLNKTEIHLLNGEIKSAIAVISTIGSPYNEHLSPWIKSAKQHQVALRISTKLTAISEEELSKRFQ